MEPLNLGKGKQKEKPVVRTIRQEHGTPILSLPKMFLDVGLKLNQEVTIEKKGNPNPLNWEIVIRPVQACGSPKKRIAKNKKKATTT